MKVFLTGSEGYIGTILAPYLLAHGHDVTGVDTGFHRVGWLYNGVDRAPSWREADIRNVTVEDLLARLAGGSRGFRVVDGGGDALGAIDPAAVLSIVARDRQRRR